MLISEKYSFKKFRFYREALLYSLFTNEQKSFYFYIFWTLVQKAHLFVLVLFHTRTYQIHIRFHTEVLLYMYFVTIIIFDLAKHTLFYKYSMTTWEKGRFINLKKNHLFRGKYDYDKVTSLPNIKQTLIKPNEIR